METSGRTEGLAFNANLVRTLLTGFIRDETRKAGFANVVLGLSGGIDSAVAAFLGVEALGKEHVLGVNMPYRTSSPESRADADLVAAQLGIRTRVVDISPMTDAYLMEHGVTDRVRAGNVMARQRMIVLYDLSSRERALVLGTSNKTEILLGYGTLYGDTACALNPLGDLYKTQIRQLASTLGVPRKVIEKRPSADLWEGQTDEGELGFSYADVDRLLYCMIDERRKDAELEAMGFNSRFVEKVRQLVRINEFKRRPPLVARI